MSYPELYRVAIIIFFMICAKMFNDMTASYESDNDKLVNKVIFFPKNIYDECDFMMRVLKGNMQFMKKTIMKENDHEKLEILERKWNMFKAQENILEEQMKLNKKFFDNMIEMDVIEKDIQNFDAVHK